MNWVSQLQNFSTITIKAPTAAADKFCDIFFNFRKKYKVWYFSRRFSWNIMPYLLLFEKSSRIWKCRLLQIIGGHLWVKQFRVQNMCLKRKYRKQDSVFLPPHVDFQRWAYSDQVTTKAQVGSKVLCSGYTLLISAVALCKIKYYPMHTISETLFILQSCQPRVTVS